MTFTKKIAATVFSAVVLMTGFASNNQASAAGLSREEAAILAGTGGFLLGQARGVCRRLCGKAGEKDGGGEGGDSEFFDEVHVRGSFEFSGSSSSAPYA